LWLFWEPSGAYSNSSAPAGITRFGRGGAEGPVLATLKRTQSATIVFTDQFFMGIADPRISAVDNRSTVDDQASQAT
jgi:hypothetical protein